MVAADQQIDALAATGVDDAVDQLPVADVGVGDRVIGPAAELLQKQGGLLVQQVTRLCEQGACVAAAQIGLIAQRQQADARTRRAGDGNGFIQQNMAVRIRGNGDQNRMVAHGVPPRDGLASDGANGQRGRIGGGIRLVAVRHPRRAGLGAALRRANRKRPHPRQAVFDGDGV
ncbi:Hypothetical protein ETEE_3303 [Edwardsiella anguillarum ET080813]|uniref:Uncharacterized protein n=1 Tax=Edwardsiella anguillarum ET080813 TaxID=667120 RepID=A0A076LST6_9GAMM|nr:Hypothetical protein ETEE_3303 [Edwardsiella anguillarum ET080813]